jgi:hypothetical protein
MAKVALSVGVVALAGFLLGGAAAQAAADRTDSREYTAPSHPRIVIHPRHYRLSPNAKRHCRIWLAKEYRVSGTVITPQMRCWWR